MVTMKIFRWQFSAQVFREIDKSMTRVYVNGVEVTKEDIEKIEIKSEAVKRILIEGLRRGEGNEQK